MDTDTKLNTGVNGADANTERELERAAANTGVVAIYANPDAAQAALRRLEQSDRATRDVQVVSDKEGLTPLVLTPTEPEPRRDRRIAFGAAGGIFAGALLGLAFYAGFPASTLTAVFSVIVGMLIGVLYGATLAGLCMPPYRDDTVHVLKRHIERGHVLLVAVGNESELRETRSVIRETQPLEVIAS